MAAPLEIIVALLVFVLVLAAYFSVVAQSFSPVERDLSLRSQAVLLSTLLITEPGHLDNGTADGSEAWEDYPASAKFSVTGDPNIKENLTGLGLAMEDVGYGVIDKDKVEAMRNVRYEHARELLGLDQLGLHFRLVVEEGDGTELLDYGPEPGLGEVFTFTRVASMHQRNTSAVPVDFPIAEKLIINEVMYHPLEIALGSGANEDELEWIELWNPNDFAVNVSGWHITNDNPANPNNKEPSADNELRQWETGGTLTVPPLEFAVVVGSGSRVFDFFEVADDAVKLRMDFAQITSKGLRPDGDRPPANPQGEKVTLVDDENKVVEFVDYRHTWGGDNYELTGDNFSLSRIDPWGDANDPANWEDSASTIGEGRGGGGTPGRTNKVFDPRFNRTQAFVTLQVFRTPTTFERVVVNEVMHTPPPGISKARNEWVELYNPTDVAIDLNGWTLADNGTTETLSGLTTTSTGAQEGILPGKGFAVVAGKDWQPDVAFNYTVHRDAVWVETSSHPIGNTLHPDDRISLRHALGFHVETVDYATTGGADDAGGETLERVDPLLDWGGTNVKPSKTDDGLQGTAGRANSWTVS